MKAIRRIAVVLLLLSTILTACAQNTSTPTIPFDTAIAATMAEMQTQQAFASTITPYVPPTETPIPPTFTPSPTLALPTFTPTRVTATPSEVYCVSGYTSPNIPNNTSMKGGSSFTKTFILTNGGQAAWGGDFKAVFVSGEQMNATDVLLDRVVMPGDSIEVSFNLTAPTPAGDHRANFMLETDKGYKFGIGPNCDRPFFVLIRTTGLFQVTSAIVKANPGSYIGTCPATINLSAMITANGVGTVLYVFKTDNGNSQTYQMDFTGAGTITSSEIPWKVTETTDLSVRIYINKPNNQDFKAITIPITCTP